MTEEERELEARCEAYRRARQDLDRTGPFDLWRPPDEETPA
ncbi:hypothetical protein ACFXJ8_09015 [Nonomuraea sp. NPDC059194]